MALPGHHEWVISTFLDHAALWKGATHFYHADTLSHWRKRKKMPKVAGDLVAHKSLCTALTSEFMSGRILGVSKTATVGTRALFLSSGNNVGPVQDMTRRCITIRLSPQCEVPAARSATAWFSTRRGSDGAGLAGLLQAP